MHKRNFKKIQPRSGLGKIQFGLGKEQVVDIVGEPDKKYKEVFEGTRLVEVWDYDELGLSLKFDGEEVLELSSFSIMSSYFKYNGTSIIGKSFERVSKVLKSQEFQEIGHEDVPAKKLIYAPELNLIVWFENDVATSLSWDISDVDVYLGSEFTEEQREEIRSKMIAYRKSLAEAKSLEEAKAKEVEKKQEEERRKKEVELLQVEKAKTKKKSLKNQRKKLVKKKKRNIPREDRVLDVGVQIANVLNLVVVVVSIVMASVGNARLFTPIAIIFGVMFLYFNGEDYREYRNKKKKRHKNKKSKPALQIRDKVLLMVVIFFAVVTLFSTASDQFPTLYGFFIFSSLLFIASFVQKK